MFTDRFIELPINLCSKEDAKMELSNMETWDGVVRLNPFEISDYMPNMDEDENDLVSVFLKNGKVYEVKMNITEFERRLNEWSRAKG